MTTATRTHESTASTLYMAMELSSKTWKLGFTTSIGQKPREKSVLSGDLPGLAEEIRKAKERFGLVHDARVVSCYEAGRDGFWIHRHLVEQGIENLVVDPGSIEGNRRGKRPKTDRLDLKKLTRNLIRWHEGETKIWSVVQVPSVADEDARQFHRELNELRKERKQHSVRIQSLLVTHGIRIEKVGPRFAEQLVQLVSPSGHRVPAQLRARLLREHHRLELVKEQIVQLERQRREAIRSSSDERIDKVRQLMRLKAIGENGSWALVMELFGWRKFANRRQVGSIAGLCGTPYASGEMDRDRGIDKAGIAEVRRMMVELSWQWLRHQPESQLSKWFHDKFSGGARLRKVGIVALARRLLVALWRWVEQGIVPEGAIVAAAR